MPRIVGYFDNSIQDNWSPEVCHRYILFPETVKTVNNTVIGCTSVIANLHSTYRVSDLNSVLNTVVFIMRLYAIYSRSVTVAVIGGCLLAGEIAVKIVRAFYSALLHSGILIQMGFGSGRLLMGRVWFCLKVRSRHLRIRRKINSHNRVGLVGCILIGRHTFVSLLFLFFEPKCTHNRTFQTISFYVDCRTYFRYNIQSSTLGHQ